MCPSCLFPLPPLPCPGGVSRCAGLTCSTRRSRQRAGTEESGEGRTQENQQGSASQPGSGKAAEMTGNCPLASLPGSPHLAGQGYEWEYPVVTPSWASDAPHSGGRAEALEHGQQLELAPAPQPALARLSPARTS